MHKKNKLSVAVKLIIAFGAASATVFTASVTAAEEDVAAKVERIEVTGSRIKRISEVSPTPVTVITGEELVNQGITNVADLLQKLPGSGVGSSPATTSNTIFGAGLNTTDLRGLGANRTLVLVNGRRFIGASVYNPAVNLNNIPTSVIERIEIVHGGASAVYGSDAVAGVVNVITKKSYDGFSFDYLTSRPEEKGGENDYYSMTVGGESGKTNWLFNASYSELGQLKESDRSFIVNPVNTMLNPANTGPSDGIPNRIILGAQTTLAAYDKAGDAFLPNPAGRANYVFGPDGSPTAFNYGDYRLPAPNSSAYFVGKGNGYNFLENSYISTPLKRFNLFSSINHEINDNHILSIETVYSKDAAFAEASPVFLAKWLRADNAFWHPEVKGWFDQAGYAPDQTIRVNKLAADFGNRNFSDDRVAANITVGLEGVIFDEYDYKLYVQNGMNTTNSNWYGELLTQNLDYALDAVEIDGSIRCALRDSDGNLLGARQGCEPLNLFGLGAASQEAIDYISTIGTLYLKKNQSVIGGSVSGYAFELPAGTVSFAVSAEYREERARSAPGTGMAKGLIFNNFVNPWQAKFSVAEAGIETSIPVLADVQFAKELTLDLAFRYMDYSSVGANSAWKAGFSWQPIDTLRVRATKSKSVRAPDINTLFSSGVQSFGGYNDPCDAPQIEEANARVKENIINNCKAAGIPVDSAWRPSEDWRQITPPSVNGGNPSLKEESSDDSLIGFIYTPTEDITLIADWWSFKVEDAINSLGAARVVANCYEASSLDNPSCRLVTRSTNLDIANVVNAAYNVATYELKGVDLEGTYKFDTSFGNFNFRLLATYLQHREFVADVFSEVYRFEPTVGEQRYPRWKARFSAGYIYDDMYLQLTADYRHSTVGDREWTIEANDYNDIPSYTKWNLNGRYDVNENLQLRAGVRNLFDITPPRNPFSYANAEFYDAYGRTYELGLNYRF